MRPGSLQGGHAPRRPSALWFPGEKCIYSVHVPPARRAVHSLDLTQDEDCPTRQVCNCSRNPRGNRNSLVSSLLYFFFCLTFAFGDRVSLFNPGCPGNSEIHLPLPSAGLKACSHHHPAFPAFPTSPSLLSHLSAFLKACPPPPVEVQYKLLNLPQHVAQWQRTCLTRLRL